MTLDALEKIATASGSAASNDRGMRAEDENEQWKVDNAQWPSP
jgi:hypothetical protein